MTTRFGPDGTGQREAVICAESVCHFGAWWISPPSKNPFAQSGLFNHLPLNHEDIVRAESYGGRAAAAEIPAENSNCEDYLTSLDMRMIIAPFDETGRSRITQLINKSNQFNLTTRRYGEEEARELGADTGVLGWQVRLEGIRGRRLRPPTDFYRRKHGLNKSLG